MKKRDKTYLGDILEAAERILEYTKKRSKKDIEADKMIQDAVVRRFEIIGEAVKRLSVELKQNHPAMDWAAMAGMRDVLIHEYDVVDIDIIWYTLNSDVPKIIKYVRDLLRDG
ncbi:MAG TPA: DUF86 domain-containing protein [bacterium]|nr:DUF86 domain-containing protein [bacterium]